MTIEKHIVLIDDEQDVVEAVSEMLELEGFTVSSYTNPDKGLKSLHANSRSVVLCDVRMPSIDGLSLLSSIQHRAPDVPVLLMSGHGDTPAIILPKHPTLGEAITCFLYPNMKDSWH